MDEPEKQAPQRKPRTVQMREHPAQIRKRYRVSVSPSTLITLILALLAFALLGFIQVNEFQRGLEAQKHASAGEEVEGEGHQHGAETEEAPPLKPEPPPPRPTSSIPEAPREELEKWAAMLESPEVDERTQAALKLREYPWGYPYLGRALDSRYEPARRAAVNALAFTDYQQVLPKLERIAVTDPSPLCREQAAYAVGKLGGPSSAAVLSRLVHADPNQWVRRAAALALGKVVPDPTARAALLEALTDSDEVVRESGARGLLRLVERQPDSEVGDALLAALQDPRAGVRKSAAQAMGLLKRIDASEALARLVDRSHEPSWEVRAAAARSLGQIFRKRAREAPQAVRALKRAKLDDPEPIVTFFADRALRAMGYAPGRM